ncbi:hypothetical protein [Bacteroides cellulosilyticus]|uniref:hypothetical protein n=1 Tax=Bacteroides cellulosilyticus TaxID=246787 RepID=UPI001A92DBB2|nr:hypothetical protein [Bacteroides cellulosilyticus]
MDSLIKYRMENLDWIDQFLAVLGPNEFQSFESRVFKALDKLQVGRYYDIISSVIPSQQELFIKFCCCYIERHPEYEFNDDYTQIWRKESYEQWKMAAARRSVRKRQR